MPRKKRKGEVPEDENLSEGELFAYMKDAYRSYGRYTLEQRAVADFRDGLKPVQRRILYATHEMGLSGAKAVSKKSAKVVGDVMGKYHPHGDSSIYGSLVQMTKTRRPTMVGVGNFGSQTDPPGSMRYTECHLSKYSDQVFFQKRYTDVMDTVNSYDGSDKEPLVLPSVLPNLLLNGSYGLAVAATSSIPAFELEGVAHLTKEALRGAEITPEVCTEHMVPCSPEGGLAFLDDEESLDELQRFFATGRGSVYWYPDAVLNTSDASVLVRGFAPGHAKSLRRSIEKVESDPNVSKVVNETDVDASGMTTDIAYRISLKTGIEDADIEDVLYSVTKYFEVKQGLVFTVTERRPPKPETSEPDVSFMYMDMPGFFGRWAEWRIALERSALQCEMDRASDRLHIAEGLLTAFHNIDAVIRIIRGSGDAKSKLVSRFGLSEAQAEAILNMRLRQLARLEQDKLEQEISDLRKLGKRLERTYRDPVPSLVSAIDELAEKLDKAA